MEDIFYSLVPSDLMPLFRGDSHYLVPVATRILVLGSKRSVQQSIVSGRDKVSPVSTRNKEEPSRGSLMMRIPYPSREAVTWKTGLNGGFGFMAMIDLVFLVSS